MSDFLVVWSDRAKQTYTYIIDYLYIEWTEKEVQAFILRTEEVVNKIKANPYLFKQYKNAKMIRKAILHRNVLLIYKISENNNTVGLIAFWGSKQNPKKLY
jgi:plasmid stabilization system protein ParE